MWNELWRTERAGVTDASAVDLFIAKWWHDPKCTDRTWTWSSETDGTFRVGATIYRVVADGPWWLIEWRK
jgi:hypothetical protein